MGERVGVAGRVSASRRRQEMVADGSIATTATLARPVQRERWDGMCAQRLSMLPIDALIDLASITRALARRLGGTGPLDYLSGKTRLRDELIDHLGCSALRAEQLVDQMEAQGYIRFAGETSRLESSSGYWLLGRDRAPA